MERRGRMAAVAGATVLLFLAVQVGALALVEPFDSAGMQAFEDPSDPTNSLLYVVLVLVATGLMLLAFRLGGQRVVRVAIVATTGLLSWYVFRVAVPTGPSVAGGALLALLPAVAVAAALWVYPEWYVIDGAGVLMGAAAAGVFGISFGVGPALVLLVVLAVYDAISVYGTEHMLTLAEGVLELRVPVVLIVPTTLSYSHLEEIPGMDADEGESDAETDDAGTGEGAADGAADAGDAGDAATADGAADVGDAGDAATADDAADVDDSDPLEREALYVGLGDAVIPTVLVASAAVFLDAPAIGLLGLNLPALGAMVGTVAGVLALLWLVFRGRAHAGLPLLNGGAIAGYLVGAAATGIPLATALGL